MLMEIQELYQELIVDHGRSPRNKGKVEDATHSAEATNPLCGDEVHLTLRVVDNVITSVRFDGCGCAISTASASLLTEQVQGKSVEEAKQLFKRLRASLVDREDSGDDLGPLSALIPIREYPMRVKCVTLAWHTLLSALGEKDASTH